MSLEAGYAVTPNIELLRELGAGGMGSVWIADHTTLHTRVAVKFVQDETANESMLKRFSREASLAAQIKSPHVVQTYDHGATGDGIPYIVMELLEGESLEDRLRRKLLSLEEVALVVGQVCKALERAHRLGIVHRDLKPGNLFLVDSGYDVFVKVLDFGIAKRTDPARDVTSELTAARAAIGTPHYMSPEALRASRELDHQADLWSLAVVAYQALTGKLPFRGETFGDQLALVLDGVFTPPSELRELTDDLDAWFKRAFSRDPAERFEDAQTFGDTLADVVEDMPASMLTATGRSVVVDEYGATATSEEGGISETDETRTIVTDEAAAVPTETSLQSAGKGTTLDSASTSKSFAGKPTPMRWPYYAGGVVAVAVAVYVLGAAEGEVTPTPITKPPARPATTSMTEASTAATPTPAAASPSPRPSSAVPAASVSLTIDSDPPRVEVKRGEEILGTAPGPIAIPRGDAMDLTFTAPGHVSKTVSVKADRDKKVTVTLPRAPAAGPKSKAKEKPVEW